MFVARSGAGGAAPGRAPLGWGALAHRRGMAISDSDVNAEMGSINDLFVEARELIADALDSQGSTYFEDDLEVSAPPNRCRALALWRPVAACSDCPPPAWQDATDMVKQTTVAYEALLDKLDEKKKGEISRLMGMKMEQLKGELGQITDALTKDEDLPSGRKE